MSGPLRMSLAASFGKDDDGRGRRRRRGLRLSGPSTICFYARRRRQKRSCSRRSSAPRRMVSSRATLTMGLAFRQWPRGNLERKDPPRSPPRSVDHAHPCEVGEFKGRSSHSTGCRPGASVSNMANVPFFSRVVQVEVPIWASSALCASGVRERGKSRSRCRPAATNVSAKVQHCPDARRSRSGTQRSSFAARAGNRAEAHARYAAAPWRNSPGRTSGVAGPARDALISAPRATGLL